MTRTYENEVVVGVFRTEENLREALEDLQELEYETGDVTLLMKDEAQAKILAEETGTMAGEGAATGAVVGGVGGVLLGLAAAAGPGGLLLAGPAALALGATGALAGGLVGGLVGLGIPEEDAKYYDERLANGEILAAVPSWDVDEVLDIFEDNDAIDMRVISVDPHETYEQNPWLSESARNRIDART